MAALPRSGIQRIFQQATDDRILIGAGVKTARALVITLPQEADNVLIALTARQLNPPLHIVARADEDRNRRQLLLAGANTVISPDEIGGLRMAIATVSPNVLDFMQVAGGSEVSGSQIEELLVGAGSRLCGVTLHDSPIMSELGLAVIGMRKAGGTMRLAPGAEETIDPGDVMIVIGSLDKLATLRDLTAAPPGTIEPPSR